MAEKKINGRTFRTSPMLATDSLVLQARLIKVAGPGIGKLLDVFQGKKAGASKEDEERANFAAVAALAQIFAGVEPRELATLIKDLVEVAEIKRPSGSYEKIDFDGDMTGKQADVLPVALFVIVEQFSDFFGGLLGLGNRAIQAPA